MSDRLKDQFELGDIDEIDETMQEQEEKLLNKLTPKDMKKKQLIKNERQNFHSGEYFKEVDIEKKMGEKCENDISQQSSEMESKYTNHGPKKPRFLPDTGRQVGSTLHQKVEFDSATFYMQVDKMNKQKEEESSNTKV